MLAVGKILRRDAHSFVGGVGETSIVVGKIRHATGVIHRRRKTIRSSGNSLRIVERLRRLDNNWVVGVSGEAERADGREGGESRGLEGDDVDAVWGGLEVDQVERSGEGQRGRALAEDMRRGHHVVIPGTGGGHHHGTWGHRRKVRVHKLGLEDTGHVGDLITRDTFINQLGHHQLLSRNLDISSRADICFMLLERLLDGDRSLLFTRIS